MSGETVLVAQFIHESNTFASSRTDRTDFRNRGEHQGEAMFAELSDTNTEVAGVLDVADRENLTLLPSIAAAAEPGGQVTADAYDYYADSIVSAVREHADEIDGIVLALHGAMVPEGSDDGEGPLIQTVQEIVGRDVPLVATLDLHGNVTEAMLEADALVAYETYAHVDMRETGRTATDLLLSVSRGAVSPTMAIERPPVLAPGPNANTDEYPMADLEALAREHEARDGVLKVNVMAGFYRADVPFAGFSIPVVTDDDPDLARHVAREVATAVWEHRDGFAVEHPGPTEAVAAAKELIADGVTADGPVVLGDVGDNPGGGAPGDETAVLEELLDQGVINAGVAFVRDPEVVETCITAGVGETVSVDLGGKSADSRTDPITVEGHVKAITDGSFVNTGPRETGVTVTMGRTVVLACGEDRGVSVIVAENRKQPWDAELWRHVGIQPERLDAIVVKSANHYRGDYDPLASEVIPIDSPGLNVINPARLGHERIGRPVYLMDEMDEDDYPDW